MSAMLLVNEMHETQIRFTLHSLADDFHADLTDSPLPRGKARSVTMVHRPVRPVHPENP